MDMYAYMYICTCAHRSIYAYMYIYIYKYIYIYIHTHTYIYIYIYIQGVRRKVAGVPLLRFVYNNMLFMFFCVTAITFLSLEGPSEIGVRKKKNEVRNWSLTCYLRGSDLQKCVSVITLKLGLFEETYNIAN